MTSDRKPSVPYTDGQRGKDGWRQRPVRGAGLGMGDQDEHAGRDEWHGPKSSVC